MKGMLKWPLIIAAVVIVLRIALEQAGAPTAVSNLVSVVALCLVIFPLYFAYRIAGANVAHPYKTLVKSVVLYAVLVRAMVIPTYWLAYIFGWTAPRFSEANGGVVGPGVTPLTAIMVPIVLLVIWTLASLVIGGGLGSAVIAIKRKSAPAYSK